jgi:hypothetical protein
VPALSGIAHAQDADGTTSVPVQFHVITSNRSGLPCATLPTDRHVVVRGHLTGPGPALDGGQVDGTL